MEKRKYNWAEYNLYYMVVGTQGIYILQKMKTKKAHLKKKKKKRKTKRRRKGYNVLLEHQKVHAIQRKTSLPLNIIGIGNVELRNNNSKLMAR